MRFSGAAGGLLYLADSWIFIRWNKTRWGVVCWFVSVLMVFLSVASFFSETWWDWGEFFGVIIVIMIFWVVPELLYIFFRRRKIVRNTPYLTMIKFVDFIAPGTSGKVKEELRKKSVVIPADSPCITPSAVPPQKNPPEHQKTEDSGCSAELYQKAAEQGDADAQNNLGLCYVHGCGVEQNYSEALKWLRKSAEQEYADAQYNLGVCYESGMGVSQDYSEALKWLRKAAEQGHGEAQYNLGLCYSDGLGVERNNAEALKWYRKAAEQGNADAEAALKILK